MSLVSTHMNCVKICISGKKNAGQMLLACRSIKFVAEFNSLKFSLIAESCGIDGLVTSWLEWHRFSIKNIIYKLKNK